MSNMWYEAHEDMMELEKQKEGMLPDQLLQLAQIKALLSIGQELSSLNPQNSMSRDDDGTTRNGWGMKISE